MTRQCGRLRCSSLANMAQNCQSSAPCSTSHSTSPTTRAPTDSSTSLTYFANAKSHSYHNGANVWQRKKRKSRIAGNAGKLGRLLSTPTCAVSALIKASICATPLLCNLALSANRHSVSSRAASP